jgi:hypothetical protein
MSVDAVLAIIVAGAIFAFVYGTYHYWHFIQKLEQARMVGKVPPGLQRRRMAIGWMIASPGVVPSGDGHRRKFMYAFAVFVGLLLAAQVIRTLISAN